VWSKAAERAKLAVSTSGLVQPHWQVTRKPVSRPMTHSGWPVRWFAMVCAVAR
jgi:hypothetical protein